MLHLSPAASPNAHQAKPEIRFPSIAAVLVGVLAVSSCGPEESAYVRVADLLPVLDVQVGTGTILPAVDPMIPELGDGWVGRSSSATEPPSSLRVRAKRAEINIVVAAPGDLEIHIEARGLSQPEDGPQTMTVRLGDQTLDRFELTEEYEAFSAQLPAELLRVGRNRVVLEFAALGPVESGDSTVLGAARVRSLSVLNSLQDESAFDAWRLVPPRRSAGRTHEARVAGEQADPGMVGSDLLMPTDSVIDLALEVPEGARLTGELIRSLAASRSTDDPGDAWTTWLADGSPAETQHDSADGARDVVASVELIDADGGSAVIYEHAFGESGWFSSPDRVSLDVSLGEWTGQSALLRLRVWGGREGTVSWENLLVTCRCEPAPPAYMGCALPSISASGRLGRPDIFIILLDAARADAFSAYGSPRPTPFVDGLAAEGTVFTRALAPSSWTAPTTASLLSGRYPDAHGVEEWDLRLPESITTLTEMLSDAGYYTFLGSHHNVYRGNRPLRRGFEGIELIDQRERDTLPDPAGLFDEDRPTFALIHLLPPHTPYEPPPPFRGAYTAGSPAVFDVSDSSLNSYSRSRETVPAEAVRYARDRYDENVAYADALVGRIIDMLRDRGRYDDAMIIVLSDHGEAFFEHGDFLHRKTLYEEVLRVPLVVKWPAGIDGYPPVVESAVSLVDLAPTLLDGVGIDDARAEFQGISLLPGVFDGVETSRAIFASTRPASGTHQPISALYRLNRKLILDDLSAPRLYDLSLDPLEQVDLARSEPVATQLLLQELRAQRRCDRMLLTGAGQVPQIELDAERLRELRALGYIH